MGGRKTTAERVARTNSTAQAGVARYLGATARALQGRSSDLRRKYCLVFDDPSDETGEKKIPCGTQQYEAALVQLGMVQPSLHRMDLWPKGAPLTSGPPNVPLLVNA